MNPDQNQRQSASQAHDWMLRAKIDIDSIFGEGYAQENPQLVGDYIKCAAEVERTYYIYEIMGSISLIQTTLESLELNGVGIRQ